MYYVVQNSYYYLKRTLFYKIPETITYYYYYYSYSTLKHCTRFHYIMFTKKVSIVCSKLIHWAQVPHNNYNNNI